MLLHLFVFCLVIVQMSPFKTSAVKGGNNKGKEHVIDVDNLSPRPKRARSPIGVYDLEKFRSCVAFQNYKRYFEDAPLLVERVVDQLSLLETKIPEWFATKDWNFLTWSKHWRWDWCVFSYFSHLGKNGWTNYFKELSSFLPPYLKDFEA